MLFASWQRCNLRLFAISQTRDSIKTKASQKWGDFINPFSVNDSIKLLIVENEEIEDDSLFGFAESYTFLPPPTQPNGSLVANSSLLFHLIINRVILFCSLKIDC